MLADVESMQSVLQILCNTKQQDIPFKQFTCLPNWHRDIHALQDVLSHLHVLTVKTLRRIANT